MITIVDMIDFLDREIEQAKSCVENATTEYSTHKNEGAILAYKNMRDYIGNHTLIPLEPVKQKTIVEQLLHGGPINCS